jgi:hypothetical protein
VIIFLHSLRVYFVVNRNDDMETGMTTEKGCENSPLQKAKGEPKFALVKK